MNYHLCDDKKLRHRDTHSQGDVGQKTASHVMKIYHIGRNINIKHKKTAIKIYYTKKIASNICVSRSTRLQRLFFVLKYFLCGNKVKDGPNAKRRNEENYLSSIQTCDRSEGKFKTCANNFNGNGIVLWAAEFHYALIFIVAYREQQIAT